MRNHPHRIPELPDEPEPPQPGKNRDSAVPAAVLVDGQVVTHTHATHPHIEIHPGTCGCVACQAARVPDAAADYF